MVFSSYPHLPGMLLAWTVFTIGVVSPGPSVLAIMGTTLQRGRRAGIALAAGVVSGSAFWGVLAAAGMSAILVSSNTALTVIRIAGGLYLLWLACKSLRMAMAPVGATIRATGGPAMPGRMWATGFAIHLTNPKAVINWIAAIALGVTEASPCWVGWAIAGGGITISLMVHTGYAVLFSSDPIVQLYLRAKRPIQLTFAVLFGMAGLRLLTSR